MKDSGYRGTFAGAVEAVASTGGQIMPPVMGAAAFIMAQFMGVPYVTIVIAAIIPALLYFIAVMVQVHFEANRLGLKGLPRDRLPRVWALLRSKGFLLLPLVIIVYFLLAGYTPLRAAFYAILSCIALSYLNKETALTPKKLAEAFIDGARSGIVVACACACVGLVIGSFTLTGLALRLAGAIVDLSQGMLLPTLFMTMIACIALGTGLPTTPNFIITSTMAAPALLLLGVEPIAAYMFVLYFGIAADVTPPVALASFAAAGIARDDPMKTSLTGAKLALAGFLVPYIFVLNPMLLMVDVQFLPLIQYIITALLGIFLLAMCTIGYYRGNLNALLRILALAGAIGMLHPGLLSDIGGFAVLVFIWLVQTIRAKKRVSPGGLAG
jgi:TRAP transporter 4TM/12TM fusion protein